MKFLLLILLIAGFGVTFLDVSALCINPNCYAPGDYAFWVTVSDPISQPHLNFVFSS